MTIEADDCPFCGSDATTSIATRAGAVVRCMDCGALGPPAMKGSGNHHEIAVLHWNKRSAVPEPLSEAEEQKLAGKARELVDAVQDVTRLIAMPALARKAAETKAILMGVAE